MFQRNRFLAVRVVATGTTTKASSAKKIFFLPKGVWMAAKKANERLALVDETQADRQTIEIYELITRKLRVPQPN